MDMDMESAERRRQQRRRFTYYMQVLDANTLNLVGHLADISLIGIRVDSEKPLPVNTNFKLRIDLTSDLSNKTYMILNGRSKWCEMDKFSPNSYNIGFEVNTQSREDTVIFQRMFEQYGVEMRH
ncbi:MAG: PilZ domain-containing protein [Anaerolineales bacterium]|jgi:hypothetical protein|nr:PilZ domain-containing protein [Anaerolineales bacterium]